MTSFEMLGLNENLLSAIKELGFTEPTPIQEQAIPVLLHGTTDFVGLAQTGTGKTAAFGLPLLQLIDPDQKYPQALIMCPTRELCLQINNDLKIYSKHTKNIFTEAIYGGSSISMQIQSLRKGVHIVVATPGRLIDLIERKAIDLKKVEYVVLDEADEMLNMGFRDDINFVLKNTPARESVWLFSATMPAEVRAIASKFMTTPAEVTIGNKNAANVNIDHQYYITPASHRFDTLKRLIDFNPDMYGIIFSRTKAGAQEIAEKLSRAGYDMEAIHGDLSQQQRDRVMKKFRDKNIQLLVATDVAARGIDVEGITHVINYELPDDPEVYTHRSGRTARAGKKGICISICHTKELFKIKQIERLIKVNLERKDIPEGNDVVRKQFFHFMDKLIATRTNEDIFENYQHEIEERFQSISKEDLIKKIGTMELENFFKYYENAVDLNAKRLPVEHVNGRQLRDRRSNPSIRSNSSNDFSKLFINLGTKDGFYKASFLQFILDESDLRKEVIGKIDLRDVNSWVEVENVAATKMMKKLNGKKFKGRVLRMNEANEGGLKRHGAIKKNRF